MSSPAPLQHASLDQPPHDVRNSRAINPGVLDQRRLAWVLHARDRLEHRILPWREILLAHPGREQLICTLTGTMQKVQGRTQLGLVLRPRHRRERLQERYDKTRAGRPQPIVMILIFREDLREEGHADLTSGACFLTLGAKNRGDWRSWAFPSGRQ